MKTLIPLMIFLASTFSFANEIVSGHPSVTATFAEKAPTIDGRLDDEEWKSAAVIDTFTQIQPVEGGVPSEKTTVKIMFDSENIYFGIQCYDSQPDAIIARQMQREGDSSSDDKIAIAIDPFGDNLNGYYFELTAGGGKNDGLVETAKNSVIGNWDTLWKGKAVLNEKGWSGEIAISFKNISFNTTAKEWGFNFTRRISRKQESIRWSGTKNSESFLNFIHAGKLAGLVGLKQGMGLIIKPFGSMLASINDGTVGFRTGFDMSYKLTPSTTALITYNTDFAEAEVDSTQVNLSRFPLFFPEKRAFFLQDTSVFSFGGIQQSPLPFYSRRIGSVQGQKKNVFAGLKVTGREGIVNFGFLDVQMEDDPVLGKKNLLVGRANINLLAESTAGIIITHGDPQTTGSNSVIGGDFNLRTSKLFGDQVLQGFGWVMGSFSQKGPIVADTSSGSDDDDFAAGLRLQFPNDKMNFSLFAGRYGENFRPALGFIARPGTWEFIQQARYRFRTEGFLRRLDVGAANTLFLTLNGSLDSDYGGLPWIELEDSFGDVVRLEHSLILESPKEPFKIINDITIPAADYSMSLFSLFIGTSANRSVSANLDFAIGGFYGGSRTDIWGELIWKPSQHFLFSGSYGNVEAKLPGGNFTIRQIRVQGNIIFSPQISWNTITQYDSVSKLAGINSRLRYEISEGQEAFLVVNQGVNISDDFVLTAGKGEVSLKLGMTFSF